MKMRNLIILFTVCCSLTVLGQNVQMNFVSKKDSFLIGDHIQVNLLVQTSSNTQISWPNLSDTLAKDLNIINISDIDTVVSNDTTTYSQLITATSFEAGNYVIHPVQVKIKEPGSETDQLFKTNPLIVFVDEPIIDLKKPISDIKDPIEVPFTIAEVLPLIGGAILIIGFLVAMLYYVFRKKKSTDFMQTLKFNKTPAHETALLALSKLKNEKLWQSGHYKKYHSQLSDIVRSYIDDRFGVNAMEMTTNELLYQAHFISEEELKNKLKIILEVADMAKFAKVEPLPDENENSMRNAVYFIEKTSEKEFKEDTNKDEVV